MAAEHHVLLPEGEFLPRGDADLPFDKVHPGHHLGHRMFHLKPSVHLHEEEFVGRGIRDQEFDGSRTHVIDATCSIAGSFTDAVPRGIVEKDGRRLLDDFLVAPLQ